MKFIGQYIQSFIARFRNDVYLEDIDTGTIVSGGNLGLDSNNKIVKATDGDITSVRITTDSGGGGTEYNALSGDVDLQIIGASGVGVTNSGAVISAAAVPGEIDHDSLLNFAADEHYTQANITTVGTIGTGVWNGTAIASAYLDSDTAHLTTNQTFSGVKTFSDVLILDGDRNYGGEAALLHLDASTITNTVTSASGTTAKFKTVGIEPMTVAATNSSVTTTDAASLYISSPPTAGTNMTLTNVYALWVDAGLVKFDGALTVDGTITGDVTGDLTGQADTVATIAGLAPNTATTQATQPAIESIGTDGDTLNILADELLMSNTTADAPIIKLVNTTDDDQASQLIFEKLRDDDAVAVGQNIGEIWFRGQDSAQNTQNYGFVLGEIDVSTSGQESGKVSLGIANHDGGNGRGLILTGGSENDEVDATLGLGANSVVTIPGNIDLAGNIDVDGTIVGQTTVQKWIKNVAYVATQSTTETFIPMVGTAENTAIGNGAVGMIMPTAGKLLKVHLKTQRDHSGVTTTVKMYNLDADEAHTTSNFTSLGVQSATGPATAAVGVFDFQSSLDSGTNAFTAGEMLAISITNSSAVSSSCKYFVTLVFELDWASY